MFTFMNYMYNAIYKVFHTTKTGSKTILPGIKKH